MLPSDDETFGTNREYSNGGRPEKDDEVRHVMDDDTGLVLKVSDPFVTVAFEKDGLCVLFADELEFTGAQDA
jgi:hypothetical protein